MTRFFAAILAALALAGCGGGSGGGSATAGGVGAPTNEGFATPSSVSVVTYTE